MDDYLGDERASAITIHPNHTWSVELHSWASAGGWYTREITYTFRLEDGCIRLVGFDNHSMHRGSGETSARSFNLLTGRGWTQAGAIEDDTPGPKRWTRLKSEARVCIRDIGNGFSFAADLLRDDQEGAGSTR